MKTCPTCRKTYDDDTLVYCLDDGARLDDPDATRDQNATLNLPVGPTIQAGATRPKGPPTAANPQPTITARPERFQMPYSQGAVATEPSSRKSSLPWIFATILVLGISGVVVAWLLTRGRDDDQARRQTGETPVASPRASPEATAEVKESPTEFAMLNNITFNGSRITYYPRQSVAQCQADCSGNNNCRGFTWIRPGAYNPGDSAMCYLMSAVTARVPHACCVSGVRN